MADDETDDIEAVCRAIERKTRLCVCAGPQQGGHNVKGGVVVSAHYQLTLGEPVRGGGYRPVAQVWVSIPTG